METQTIPKMACSTEIAGSSDSAHAPSYSRLPEENFVVAMKSRIIRQKATAALQSATALKQAASDEEKDAAGEEQYGAAVEIRGCSGTCPLLLLLVACSTPHLVFWNSPQ